MSHLLGTPSSVPDALPRPLTALEWRIRKQKQEEQHRKTTVPTPKVEHLYSEIQDSSISYKKVDFAPNYYNNVDYAPIYYTQDPYP